MEPLRYTAGNPLPSRANPALHWNTYLQVQLFFLLSVLVAPMEPLRDTAGNPLSAEANPSIHWNTYLQVRLFVLLSCPGGAHGTPKGHCREPPASRSQPCTPLEHLSPGTVVLLAFLPWRQPWNPCGTLQGTLCHQEPTPPSTGTLISRYGCTSSFPALEAPMEPLRDTAGNPLPARANPAIYWNTYLQVRLFFLLSCPGGAHGAPV
jgi:hypothetical protein